MEAASSALLQQGNAQCVPGPRLAVLPLLQLPSAVVQEVLSSLPPDGKRSLRLVSKDAVALVDACVRKLRISNEGPFKGACSLPLAPRFPLVTTLKLHAGWCEDRNANSTAFESLVQGEQWHAVTSLQLTGLAAVTASKAISACPATKVCVLMDLWDNAYSFGLPQLLQHTCKALPCLSSLTVSHPLGDKELAALASCPFLETLDIMLGGTCSSDGWAALLGSAVRMLTLQNFEHTILPANAMATWADGMTSLTHLTLDPSHTEPPCEDVLVQLPPSLIELNIFWAVNLIIPCSPLPRLTVLELLFAKPLRSAELALIAANCPVLLSLSVDHLQLDPACHAAPLFSPTRLSISSATILALHTRWALIFPRLTTLELMGLCSMPIGPQASVFEGLSLLECLSIGPARDEAMDAPGWAMQPCDVTALSCLKELRLLASTGNIECVATMSTLQSLTLLFDNPFSGDLVAVTRALATGHAPLSLTAASIMFDGFQDCFIDVLESYPDEDAYNLIQTGMQLAQVATALPCWLMRGAPLLKHVCWQQGNYPGLTDCSLLALAAHPSMAHIDLGMCLGDITRATLQHVRKLFAQRGLTVTVATSDAIMPD